MGNPAGVVVEANNLSDNQMQLIAREINNSETAFLLSVDDNSCDGAIRYFTPTTEVPICGHATIAALYVKAITEGLGSCTLNMRTSVGVLPMEIEKSDQEFKITMTQGPIQIAPPLGSPQRDRLLSALGLVPGDLDHRCPIQIASTGHSKVMIGVEKRAKLNSLDPNMTMLTELSPQIECNGYFVFTFDSGREDILTTGRMFAPAIGITEDPVTGNAYGPLGAYLIHNKIVEPTTDRFSFTGLQGETIGRVGTVGVHVLIENGTPVLVKITGEAVLVFRATMLL